MSTNDAVAAPNEAIAAGDDAAAHPRATVLCLDDDEAVLDLLDAYLSREGSFEVLTTTDPSEGLQVVARGSVDLVVSDYEMGDTTGLEFLDRVRARDSDLPFVLFTSHGTPELAADASAAGATDLVRKGGADGLDRLAERLSSAVGVPADP